MKKESGIDEKISRVAYSVGQSAAKSGPSAGIAALILGSVSALQAAMSGFEAGREFAAAVECVEEGSRSRGTDGNGEEDEDGSGRGKTRFDRDGRGCDVILADRTVEQTLSRAGMVPSVSYGMIQSYAADGFDWGRSELGMESRRLAGAVWGHPDLLLLDDDADVHDGGVSPQQVDMGRVLTRDWTVRSDLARLTIPPLIFAQTASMVGERVFDAALLSVGGGGEAVAVAVADAAVASSPHDLLPGLLLPLSDPSALLSTLSDVSTDLLTFVSVLAVGYITAVLPAFRIILSERDDVLAEGVRSACRLAKASYSSAQRAQRDGDGDGDGDDPQRPPRVVAVLGLLHVNGVARRLILSE